MEGFSMSQRASQLGRQLRIVLLLGSVILISGCGADQAANPSNTSPAEQKVIAASPATETTSVAAAKSTNLTSPAATANELSLSNESPEDVCRRFMKLLQSGNRIGAENLLTRTALTTTTRAGLKLEPMGGPNSVYEIGDVRFATNKMRLAQVECKVIDKIDDQNYEMDMTWQLHKHRTGWRISGVMLVLQPGQAKDLLSFENIQDVTRLQFLADAAVLDEVEATRQAKATSDPSTINK